DRDHGALEVGPGADGRTPSVERGGIGNGRLDGGHDASDAGWGRGPCATREATSSSRRSGRASRCQIAYSKESCSAVSDAAMMFASAPAVIHVPDWCPVSMITLVRAAVAASPSMMRTL